MDERRIREIVREELAAQQSETVTLTVDRKEFGRAAIEAIKETQRSSGKKTLEI